MDKELKTCCLNSMIHIFLQMHNTSNIVIHPNFLLIYDEMKNFEELYNNKAFEISEKEEMIDLLKNELTEGLYLSNGLDRFNEGITIFFRNIIYNGSEDYKNSDLYNLIIDAAKEICDIEGWNQ